MPKPFGDFLNALAIKSGIDPKDAGLIGLLSNQELSKVTLPDELVAKFESNLHSLDSAKANQTLKNHFYSEIYDGIDVQVGKTMQELGLEQTIIDGLNTEKSTPKKIKNLVLKVRELEQAKNAGAGDGVELKKTINALNAELAKLKTDHETNVNQMKSTHEDELANAGLSALISRYDYAGEMDLDLKLQTALFSLTNAFAADGIKVIRDKTNPMGLKLVKSTDGTDYFNPKNNQKADVKSYVETVFADKKLLKTKDTPPGNGGGGGGDIPPAGKGGLPGGKNSFMSELDKQIADVSA